ncbi:hypothetical protein [Blastococcus sp. SYSU DS0539]
MSTSLGGARRGISWLSRLTGAGGIVRHASNVVDVDVDTDDRGHPSGRDGQVASSPDFTVFAAMPFDPDFDDVFFVAIRAAVSRLGGTAVRVDRLMHGGDAVAATHEQLRDCAAVVADVSTNEPDVLYELGVAHGLGKPSVLICRTRYEDLPFMVRNRETLLYEAGRTHALGQQLAVYLAAVLSRT